MAVGGMCVRRWREVSANASGIQVRTRMAHWMREATRTDLDVVQIDRPDDDRLGTATAGHLGAKGRANRGKQRAWFANFLRAVAQLTMSDFAEQPDSSVVQDHC